MTDVIIAIVPAPGHEGLVAEGPLGERPATLVRFKPWGGNIPPWTDRANFPMNYAPSEFDYALVLYAPGGPRLGMVRLSLALGLNYDPTPNDISARTMGNLARSCGLASEVLVLPVPS